MVFSAMKNGSDGKAVLEVWQRVSGRVGNGQGVCTVYECLGIELSWDRIWVVEHHHPYSTNRLVAWAKSLFMASFLKAFPEERRIPA